MLIFPSSQKNSVVAVAVIKTQLISIEDSSADRVMWRIAIAIVAGFGASELIDRLRLLTQTLFGRKT